MRWRTLAAVVALALAALLLSRDHARAVRADRAAAERTATRTVADEPAAAGEARVARSPARPEEPEGAETLAVEVVSAPDGRPVPDARVEVWENWVVVAATSTDASGRASVAARRAGGTHLVAYRRGFVPAYYWLDAEEREPPTIRLGPGLAVDGLVTLADTGQPAAGAEILVLWPLNMHLGLRADAHGRFGIPGVESAVSVRAHLPGYAPAEVQYEADPARPWVEVVLGRGGTCEGRVLDEAGRPVAGASVRAGGAETTTDPEGRFTLRGLAEGEELRASAHTSDHRGGTSDPFTCDADHPVHRRDIVVRPYARVAVTLSFPDGSPVAEARVAVSFREDWSDQRWCQPVAGAPGLFESGPVEPGPNELRVDVPGWPFQARKILVSPRVRTEIAFRLEEKLGLAGVVVDREGRPLKGVEVDYSGEDGTEIADAHTDAQGRFRLRGLPDTQGMLVCAGYDPGHVPVATSARPGQAPVRIVLERRPRIVGRLDPVPEGLTASVGCEDGHTNSGVRVGRDGRFELRNMAIPAEREFWLKLEVEGRLPWVFLGLRLAPEETLDLGVLRPREGVTLEGVVTDRTGTPLPNADVSAWAELEDLNVGGGDCTDGTGRFLIPGLVDVAFEVRVEARGHVPRRVRAARPGRAPLAIVLEPGGTLELRGVDEAEEEAIDEEYITIEPLDGGEAVPLAVENGEAEVVLPPGRYRIGTRTFEIRAGETTVVDLGR